MLSEELKGVEIPNINAIVMKLAQTADVSKVRILVHKNSLRTSAWKVTLCLDDKWGNMSGLGDSPAQALRRLDGFIGGYFGYSNP